MVYKVYADESFLKDTMALAEKLAAMPTRSLAMTKHALNYSFTQNFEEQLALEDKLQQEAALTYDYREGVEAFMQKRTPLLRRIMNCVSSILLFH